MHHLSSLILLIAFVLGSKPSLSLAQEASLDHSPQSFVAEIRRTKPKLADELEGRLKQSQGEVDSFKRGHVVFGRVEVEGGKDPRSVTSQMIILEDGYFADAVGVANRPIGFRLHGYEPLDVVPKGPGPTENLGVIHMKLLPAERLATVKGRLQIEARQGAPRPNEIEVALSITSNPINTPHNGTEGYNPVYIGPTKAKVSDDGSFSLSGLSPTQYYLSVTAPNTVSQGRTVDFTPGETKQLEPVSVEVIRKMQVEYAVSPTGDFRGAKISKTTLAANDRWRVNEETPQYASDLKIGQRDGKLLLGYSYGPCHITELGAAELSDKLGVGPNAGTLQQPTDVPVEDGHVYLVHQASWKHWILLRAALLDSSSGAGAAVGPKESAPRSSKARSTSTTKIAGSTKTKTSKAPATEKKNSDRIKALLDWAKANDDEEHGPAALAALNELLKLEPGNTEARRLRAKIAKYYSGD